MMKMTPTDLSVSFWLGMFSVCSDFLLMNFLLVSQGSFR